MQPNLALSVLDHGPCMHQEQRPRLHAALHLAAASIAKGDGEGNLPVPPGAHVAVPQDTAAGSAEAEGHTAATGVPKSTPEPEEREADSAAVAAAAETCVPSLSAVGIGAEPTVAEAVMDLGAAPVDGSAAEQAVIPSSSAAALSSEAAAGGGNLRRCEVHEAGS